MRYVYAALLLAATVTPWVILAVHLHRCRRDARTRAVRAALQPSTFRNVPAGRDAEGRPVVRPQLDDPDGVLQRPQGATEPPDPVVGDPRP